MSYTLSKKEPTAETRSVASGSDNSADDDNKLLEIGYVPSFKREFSNIATVCACIYRTCDSITDVRPQISFAFSIMGLCSSVATTFNTPLLVGGPSSVTWCWILGATMCFTLGAYLPIPSTLRRPQAVPDASE